jgi:two-component system, chemotaxis family, sensor kinase CheA
MTKEEVRSIFIDEASEIIERLDIDIINYEEDPSNKEILNGLFRGVHTLKGSANSFGFTRLGAFVHHFEDLLDRYRSLDESAPSHVIEIFFKSVDVIKETMEIDMKGEGEPSQAYHSLLEAIKQHLEGEDEGQANGGGEVTTVVSAVDVSTAPVSEKIRDKGVGEEKHSIVKIDTLKLDELFDSVGEMVIAQNFLAENDEILLLNSPTLNRTIDNLNKITKLIQKRVMSLRMVPVHDTFEKMKRVVRDASKKVGKEIEFHIEGEETEVDKTMVDLLSDPLIHIMRNAIDHGIEHSAQERLDGGKTAKGHVSLRAFHKGGSIGIEVRDDGAGIDRDKVYKKALERGIISEEDELNDQQIYGLIMQAGFSTADTISDISGRGVGLDVVRSSIEKLHGKIEIDSKKGEGSVFTIWLPLTLAIIDGMLVKSAGDVFIIPTLSVIESFRPDPSIVHTAKGEGEFVTLRGEMIPVLRLNRILQINEELPTISESILICIESDTGKYALLIDELIGRQQVVIKPLGKALESLEGISGGAIMGNGEIALILNVDDLVYLTTKQGG